MLVINRLHELLRPFMLRRVKTEVMGQLPEKVKVNERAVGRGREALTGIKTSRETLTCPWTGCRQTRATIRVGS